MSNQHALSTASDFADADASPAELCFSEAALKRFGHQIIDDLASYLSTIRERPVWQPLPDAVRRALREQELPHAGRPFEETLTFLEQMVLPFPLGNGHPRFAGWITSAPAHAAILLQPLAAAMDPNCGLGEHAGQELERRTVQWVMQLCDFPLEGSAGVFVSGGSEANFTCLQAARFWAGQQDGWNVRTEGVQGMRRPFVLYQSDQGHFCIRRAVEAMGLGSSALRIIPSTPDFQMDVEQLRRQIRLDREAGLRPFCVVGSAGTVETGAVDPFEQLADLCAEEGLWFHVDGAYGAFGRLDPRVATFYKGMERADSLATDQHKWLSVPIDCGCALVRDGAALYGAFNLRNEPAHEEEPWLSEYTLQRTRRFRALDVWAVVRSAGREGLAAAIAHNIALARLLGRLVESEPELELLSAGPLSIVRFRYAPEPLRDRPRLLDRLNAELAREIQRRGRALLTSTRLRGKELLRACLVNYMTAEEDIHALIDETLTVGRQLAADFR